MDNFVGKMFYRQRDELIRLQKEIKEMTGLRISIPNLVQMAVENFIKDIKSVGFIKDKKEDVG